MTRLTLQGRFKDSRRVKKSMSRTGGFLLKSKYIDLLFHPLQSPKNQKYIVRLSDEERGVCQAIVKRLKGTSEKVKRAQILLRAEGATKFSGGDQAAMAQ